MRHNGFSNSKLVPNIGIVIGQLSHGGAERQVALLARGLLESKCANPIIFCLSEYIEPHGSYLQKSGVQWYAVPEQSRTRIGKLYWLIKKLRAAQCDLVYGILHVGNIYAGMAAFITRLPFITSIRTANEVLPVALRFLSSYFCRHSVCVIANSGSCITSLYEYLNVDHRRVRLIPNAVLPVPDLATATSMFRREFGIPEDATLIGTVALLKPQKRPEFFIDACLKILNKNAFAYFVWVGDGLEKHNVAQIINSLPASLKSHFRFPGTRNDIWGYLKSVNLFILTSAYEGMPNALLEAMAVGLPCVATNVAGTKDVLSGGNDNEEIGILASSSNPQQFADAVLELLANPVRMKKMGKSAQKHIQDHYSLEKMVSAHCDVFYDALALNKVKI